MARPWPSARTSPAPQHVGLGSRLILEAKRLSRAAGFDAISVIAATGTQGYYAERGFERVGLYMVDRGLGIGE